MSWTNEPRVKGREYIVKLHYTQLHCTDFMLKDDDKQNTVV